MKILSDGSFPPHSKSSSEIRGACVQSGVAISDMRTKIRMPEELSNFLNHAEGK